MVTIDKIGYSLSPMWSKEALTKMIEQLGREETCRRFAWLFDGTVEECDVLIDAFFNDDYVDDKGVKGGRYFWGDL